MAEYINKTKLIEAMETYQYDAGKDGFGIMVLIGMQPVVDVVPVKYGEWEYVGKYDTDFEFACPACGETLVLGDVYPTPNGVGFNYCLNCGAKMD